MDEFIYLCSLRNEETAVCLQKILRQEGVDAKIYAMPSGDDPQTEDVPLPRENDQEAMEDEVFLLYVLCSQFKTASKFLSVQPADDRFEESEMVGTLAPDADYLDTLTYVGNGTQPYDSVRLPSKSNENPLFELLTVIRFLLLFGGVYCGVMAYQSKTMATTILYLLATLIFFIVFMRLRKKKQPRRDS